ncbi:MAG: DNA polymerase/3'-5' exonuclease PolX, partial [Mesorhizobium sp.]
GALTKIPGIGDAIADIVTKLYQTGTHPSLEKLREDVPAGVMELFAIPGLRPDKILKLHQLLGVNSLAELEAAAREDRIRPVKGLGAALQTKLLQSLAIVRSGETQLHLHKAAALLEHAVISVKQEHPEFSRVEIAGDFRRGCELVSDFALVAHGILHSHTTASDGTETLEAMAEATRKRGFEYYGVADHSQSAHYAGGLSLQEIAEQHREADRLNKACNGKFRILKG